MPQWYDEVRDFMPTTTAFTPNINGYMVIINESDDRDESDEYDFLN